MSADRSVIALVSLGADGSPTRESGEVIGAASALASSPGWTLVAACPSSEPPSPDPFARLGVASVIHLEPRSPASVVEALAGIRPSPAAFFCPDSLAGQDVAVRLAAALECDVVRGCDALRASDNVVRLGRQYLGGRASLDLEWRGEGHVVITVAPGAFGPPARATTAAAVRIESVVCPDVEDERVRKVGEIAPTPEGLRVEEAEVLVAGGAGVAGADGFGLLRELAGRLGGTVAASRVAVDRGWAPYDRQIGQTGKSVSPKLYFAVGISGAPQHIAGIKTAGKVIALNRDPRAAIFDVADLAVVADLWEVLPCLIERLPSTDGASTKGVRA